MLLLGPSARRMALLCAFFAGGATLTADDKAPESFYFDVGQRSGPENLIYGFFEPESGRRVARLQVAQLRLDYGKRGVFRVAWKARPLLNGVELRIDDAAAWPGVVGQLGDAFRKMGGTVGVVIRDLVIVQPGDLPRITAAEAELTPAHELVLPRASVGEGEARRVVLALTGPQAGQIQIFDLQVPTSSRSGASP